MHRPLSIARHWPGRPPNAGAHPSVEQGLPQGRQVRKGKWAMGSVGKLVVRAGAMQVCVGGGAGDLREASVDSMGAVLHSAGTAPNSKLAFPWPP